MPPVALPVDDLNRLQREAYARADELEPRFVRVLEPILNRSADEASTRFARFATDYLTASGAPSARTGDRAALTGMSRAEARGLLASLALTAAADITPRSTMVALYPRAAEAAALAESGAEDPAVMHVTLCYLGEVDPSAAQAVAAALGRVAVTHPPLAGTVGGIASFDDQGNGHPAILLPDVPGLVELRLAVCEAVLASGSDYARNHGYAPHLTVAYRENGPQPPEATSLGAPLHFDAIHVVQGDVVLATLPLTGAPALTAAADPGWLAPAANEVVDVEALVAELRGKTDPVRLAVVRDSMTPVLEGAGLSFDVTNPLAANVLAQSGSQITNIAETTQLNAMRIIRRSYEEGLSIPDTAKAIRVGMREASTARATLIARTELAGATNGGALASVQIVDGATGQQHFKEWLTSDGARHPRHDHYEGLDHQTRPLHDVFSVGGHPMMFPGDPAGPVGEVVNCFPAETLIVAPGALVGFRRRYVGRLIRIETDARHALSGTPNHPVLTSSGWQPLDRVREGDYLVCGALREDKARVHPDVDHTPSPIEEVVRALARRGVTGRISGVPVQFHGDGSDGEIEVVTTDRYLGECLDAALGDPLLERQFVWAGVPEAALAPTGFPLSLAVADGGSAPGLVRGRGKSFSLVGAGASHPDGHRGSSSAWLNTELEEQASYDSPADAVSYGEGLLGDSFAVTLTKVVKVDVESFHGEVFNLQTESGAYLAAGIIAHNCRCALVWKEKPGDGQPTNAGVTEPPLRIPGDTVGADDFPPAPRPVPAEVESLAQNVLTRAVMAEPAVTADIRALTAANGGELVGLAHKMKAAPSLARKIAADAAEKNLSVAEAAGGINDALRYTAVFEPADYAAAAESTLGGFEARGYQVVKAKNYWERGDAYNGINAVLESPTGQRLELQFHTPASLGVKEDVLHPLYEEFRVGASGARRAELWKRMVDAADGIAFPARVKSVGTLVRQDA